mmetsp:Transcript_19058/g.35385  ORF Transcript_19058/g.35385 Transcript_19058/m.35385 type:complete len:82 (-) Transcript_19058:675-920(-)
MKLRADSRMRKFVNLFIALVLFVLVPKTGFLEPLDPVEKRLDTEVRVEIDFREERRWRPHFRVKAKKEIRKTPQNIFEIMT